MQLISGIRRDQSLQLAVIGLMFYLSNILYCTMGYVMGLATSGYIGFSAMPLCVASGLGACSALAGVGLVIWAVLQKFSSLQAPWGWASTVSIILFVGGMQLGVLGVIGEYLSRTYDEVRRRPLYIISRQLDRRTSSLD